MVNPQKGGSTTNTILVIIVILLVIFGVVFLTNKDKAEAPADDAAAVDAEASVETE